MLYVLKYTYLFFSLFYCFVSAKLLSDIDDIVVDIVVDIVGT